MALQLRLDIRSFLYGPKRNDLMVSGEKGGHPIHLRKQRLNVFSRISCRNFDR